MKLKASMPILIIEGGDTIRQGLKRMLLEIGFTKVSEAKDGEIAWSKVEDAFKQNRPFQLVICDNEVDKLSALEIKEKLQSHTHWNKDCAFLLTLSDSDQQKVMAAIQSGITDLMVKPYSAQNLIDKIDTIFKRKIKKAG